MICTELQDKLSLTLASTYHYKHHIYRRVYYDSRILDDANKITADEETIYNRSISNFMRIETIVCFKK